MKKNNLIKILGLIVCLILSLSLVSCSKNTDNSIKETTSDFFIYNDTSTENKTEETTLNKKSENINQEFEKLRENLSLIYPVITSLNISEYLDLVEKECDKMVKDKKIQSYERTDNSIYIQIDDNSAYLFMPQLADEN